MAHIPAERRNVVAQYRMRKKLWILEAKRFPPMPADQWSEFMKWVSGFGVPSPTRHIGEGTGGTGRR